MHTFELSTRRYTCSIARLKSAASGYSVLGFHLNIKTDSDSLPNRNTKRVPSASYYLVLVILRLSKICLNSLIETGLSVPVLPPKGDPLSQVISVHAAGDLSTCGSLDNNRSHYCVSIIIIFKTFVLETGVKPKHVQPLTKTEISRNFQNISTSPISTLSVRWAFPS